MGSPWPIITATPTQRRSEGRSRPRWRRAACFCGRKGQALVNRGSQPSGIVLYSLFRVGYMEGLRAAKVVVGDGPYEVSQFLGDNFARVAQHQVIPFLPG